LLTHTNRHAHTDRQTDA